MNAETLRVAQNSSRKKSTYTGTVEKESESIDMNFENRMPDIKNGMFQAGFQNLQNGPDEFQDLEYKL